MTLNLMYEHFDHTADLGLRMQASTLPELFAEAGRALTSAIIANVEDLQCETGIQIEISGEDRDYLLFDWLNELLFHFEQNGLLLWEFEIAIDESGLNATTKGDTFDTLRHVESHEVKAITYHGLRIEETADGFAAEVIVDI